MKSICHPQHPRLADVLKPHCHILWTTLYYKGVLMVLYQHCKKLQNQITLLWWRFKVLFWWFCVDFLDVKSLLNICIPYLFLFLILIVQLELVLKNRPILLHPRSWAGTDTQMCVIYYLPREFRLIPGTRLTHILSLSLLHKYLSPLMKMKAKLVTGSTLKKYVNLVYRELFWQII